MKAFLGLAQYYALYMKDYAKVAVPLLQSLRTGSETQKVAWTGEMKVAITKIKKDLLSNVVLDIADPMKPYILVVDASDYAVGWVLSQYNAKNELRPVAFFSRKLQGINGKGQLAWSVRDKETYAIVLVLMKFRSWLASSWIRIIVLTDHQSLQHWYTEDLSKVVS